MAKELRKKLVRDTAADLLKLGAISREQYECIVEKACKTDKKCKYNYEQSNTHPS